MKTHSIPFNDDDKDRYLDLEDLMKQIRNILAAKIDEKPELIRKFDG
jgi:dynein heavy chain